MGSIGMQELLVILVILLIIFGPKRLPGIGSGLGKAIHDFKKAFNSDQDEIPDDPQKKEVPRDNSLQG